MLNIVQQSHKRIYHKYQTIHQNVQQSYIGVSNIVATSLHGYLNATPDYRPTQNLLSARILKSLKR